MRRCRGVRKPIRVTSWSCPVCTVVNDLHKLHRQCEPRTNSVKILSFPRSEPTTNQCKRVSTLRFHTAHHPSLHRRRRQPATQHTDLEQRRVVTQSCRKIKDSSTNRYTPQRRSKKGPKCQHSQHANEANMPPKKVSCNPTAIDNNVRIMRSQTRAPSRRRSCYEIVETFCRITPTYCPAHTAKVRVAILANA